MTTAPMSENAVKFEPLVNIEKVAGLLDVSVPFIRKWVQRGKVRVHVLGRKMHRFRFSEVVEDLEKMRAPGRPRKLRK